MGKKAKEKAFKIVTLGHFPEIKANLNSQSERTHHFQKRIKVVTDCLALNTFSANGLQRYQKNIYGHLDKMFTGKLILMPGFPLVLSSICRL